MGTQGCFQNFLQSGGTRESKQTGRELKITNKTWKNIKSKQKQLETGLKFDFNVHRPPASIKTH